MTIISLLVLANVVMFGLLFTAGHYYAILISPGVLAYTFGLRHAVDADHIAAIDNVTRKLVADGQQPLLVGFWFSLGHSTIVFVMCAAVAMGSHFLQENSGAKETGRIIGTCVSATVLMLFGLINLGYSIKLLRRFLSVRRSRRAAIQDQAVELSLLRVSATTMATTDTAAAAASQEEHDALHAEGTSHDHNAVPVIAHSHPIQVGQEGEVVYDGASCITRCCPCVFRVVNQPWKMYPIGVLFGLGFDTASEVSLLALAAMGGGQAVPPGYVMLLPLMFAVGMSLLDTLDGILMLYAYQWANVDVVSKLWYNMYLTMVSAVVALSIALIELLGLIQSFTGWTGGFWEGVEEMNDASEFVGWSVVIFFGVSVLISLVTFKLCVTPILVKDYGASREQEELEVQPSTTSSTTTTDTVGMTPEQDEQQRQEDYIRKRLVQIVLAPPSVDLYAEEDF